MSHVFDDSDDEFEDEYTESNKIISKIEKQLQQNRKDIDEQNRSDEIHKAVEAETKRIYTEAKEMFDEQLQKALKRIEKRNAVPAELEKSSSKRRQIIKMERRSSCDNDASIQASEEILVAEEFDSLMQSDEGDDSNDVNANENDNENMRDYNDIVDYVPTEEEEAEENEDEGDEEYELPISKRRKSTRKDSQVNETNYTVLDSGDVALTTELVDVGDFPESEGTFGVFREKFYR